MTDTAKYAFVYIVFAMMLTLCLNGCGPAVMADRPGSNQFDLASQEAPPQEDRDDDEAAAIAIDNGDKNGQAHVAVVSWRDMPFREVKKQGFDYSCGSAAIATLMTYVYGVSASERDVFMAMYTGGDQQKIRREGFSMLDMSRYLSAQGMEAKGFKLSLKAVEERRMPVIALINNKGYSHFVVIKSVRNGRVLVADSNNGDMRYSENEFNKIWNGIALVVVNKAHMAQASFDDEKKWRFARASIADMHDGWNDAAALRGGNWQLSPGNADLLPATQMGLAAVPAGGGG